MSNCERRGTRPRAPAKRLKNLHQKRRTCAVVPPTFPLLNRGLGPAGTFWIYSAICAAGFLFIRQRLPETRGKTLEQIEKLILK
jgi:hypothetical protein